MELETAARRYLLAHPLSAGNVGTRVYKFRLQHPVEGTGLCAIVVNRGPGWATPDTVQTPEFPRLVIDVVADPSRVSITGEIAALDAEDKAFAVHRAIKPMWVYPQLNHTRIGGFGSRPGLMVVRSQRWAEPRILTEHVSRRASGRSGVLVDASSTDTVTVRCEYALTLAHDG